jgi:hypothetical protein
LEESAIAEERPDDERDDEDDRRQRRGLAPQADVGANPIVTHAIDMILYFRRSS